MHIINFLYDGGTETYIYTLVSLLDRSRYEFSICCLVEAGFGADRFTSAGVPVHVLAVKRDGGIIRGLGNVLEVFRLARLLRREEVDIVHSHDNFPASYARIAAMLARVPIVYVTYHNIYHWLTPLNHLINRYFASLTTRIVAVSRSAMEYSMEKDGIPAGKYRVIYNGVDPNQRKGFDLKRKSYRRELDIPENAQVIGNVASLSQRKGQRLLISALAAVGEIYPQAVIVIVGSERDDEPLVRQSLEAQAAGLGLSERLFFTGSRTDVQDLFSMFDIYVMPSETEGFGYALVEAMSAGVPAIAADIPALSEVSEYGKNALLFRSGDFSDLAQKLEFALGNPDKMREMAEIARVEANEKFSLDRMVSGYQSMYDEDVEARL